MLSPRRIILGVTLVLGVLVVAIPGVPGQNPANPKGLDVSHFQGTINWTNVKNAGISFVIIKATENTTIVDSAFATNWAGAKSVGLVRAAYHFARPSTSPTVSGSAIAQANFFINTVQPQKGDLQLCLDFEATGSLTPANLNTWVQAFCNQVQTTTHRAPFIYCSPSFWTSNMPSGASNFGCPLWIANWGVSSPTIPSSWSTYTLWQYSSTGNVAGLNPVDQDTCNGGAAFLQTFTFPRDPLNRR